MMTMHDSEVVVDSRGLDLEKRFVRCHLETNVVAGVFDLKWRMRQRV